MKKWLIGLLVGIFLIIALVYVFIPNTMKFESTITVNATRPGLHRILLNKNSTAIWWPGTISNDSFYLNQFAYAINRNDITVLPVTISGQNITLTTSLFLI